MFGVLGDGRVELSFMFFFIFLFNFIWKLIKSIKQMMASSLFNLIDDDNKNWCCYSDHYQEPELVGYRKNIIPKSAQKNQKKEKTSLKKRSGTIQPHQQPKKEQQNHATKYDNTPPKPQQVIRLTKPHEVVISQRPHMVPIPAPTINHIRYTPQKARNPERKINFVYSNKVVPMKLQNLGVNDLQSFQQPIMIKKQFEESKRINFSQPTTAFNSQSKVDPYKSTQHTLVASQKMGSWDQSQKMSMKNYQMDQFVNVGSQRRQRQRRDALVCLSSRKQTVLSINGDSESQESIAIQDFQPLSIPMIKYNSNEGPRMSGQKYKVGHSSLKTSINF